MAVPVPVIPIVVGVLPKVVSVAGVREPISDSRSIADTSWSTGAIWPVSNTARPTDATRAADARAISDRAGTANIWSVATANVPAAREQCGWSISASNSTPLTTTNSGATSSTSGDSASVPAAAATEDQ